jgi:concanavalin A-like lectin/glucanase superfamily protein
MKTARQFLLIAAILLASPGWAGRSFSGSGQYITASGISTPLDISTGNETVSFWWYPTSTTTQAAVAHYIFGTSGGQFAVGIAYGTGSAGQLTWAVGCCGSITGTSYGNCPTAVTLNHWYQIILYSVSGSVTGLIVNGGSFCNSNTAWDSATISAGGTNFTIGAQGNGLYPASGIIAEVAVWPSNLSAGFKQALATVCPMGPTARRMGLPKPVGYFPLWGASGSSTEPDLSGNVLNGTLTGPPTAANHAPCTP